METYKFVFSDKTYELGEDNCDDFLIDEEQPVTGIDKEEIIKLLNEGAEVDFDVVYYAQRCESCNSANQEKAKAYKFLEYHFYIFTKNGEYVISTISEEYKNTSFTRLSNAGKVDDSYIVSVIVCVDCGNYSVEIEQCEV
jgi:hypothetical protein